MNVLGVSAVAFLCLLQWRLIARIDADRDRIESIRQSQAKRIEEQDKTIRDEASDLEEFRGRLTLAEGQLNKLQRELDEAIVERNQLHESLQKWKAAVSARDVTIRQATTQISSLIAQRDAVITQFNDVAIKYNELIKKATQ